VNEKSIYPHYSNYYKNAKITTTKKVGKNSLFSAFQKYLMCDVFKAGAKTLQICMIGRS